MALLYHVALWHDGMVPGSANDMLWFSYIAGSHFMMHYLINDILLVDTIIHIPLVPFCMASKDQQFKLPSGYNVSLSDVAPTILRLMGIDKPVDMTGISLI